MSRFFRLSLLLFLLLGVTGYSFGTSQTSATTERQIRQAMDSFPALLEFGQLYTNGFYNLKHENGRYVVEVRTLVRPAYELIMRVPVRSPEMNDRLVQEGPAEVELWKIKRIYRDMSPTLTVERETPQHIISQPDWVTLYNNKGDFTSIGITMNAGMELQLLREYRDQLRKEADVSW